MTKFSSYLPLLLLLAAFTIISCDNDFSNLGLDIIPPDDMMKVNTTDTLLVTAYSVREDSVRTDELPNSLLGSFFDPIFGITTASIYTELRLSEVALNFGDEAVIDSIVLYLAYRQLYGDSVTAQTFTVYELTDNLHLDSAYYSNQTVPFNSSLPLGSVTTPPPLDSLMIDSVMFAPQLRIPLNNGNILANKFLDADPGDFISNENFRQFFKGLHIAPTTVEESGKGAIMTFDLLSLTTRMVIYYHNNNADSLRYSFFITNAAARFNNYEHYDYQHADELLKQQVLYGDTLLGDQILYLHPLGGIKTYLKIPALTTLGKMIMADQIPMISINEAKITFNNYESEPILAPSGRLVIAKVINDKGTTTILDDQLEGELYFGGVFNRSDNNYSFRLSLYAQDRLLHPLNEDFGLALLISGASTVPQRVILKGAKADPGRVKLVITYTEVDVH